MESKPKRFVFSRTREKIFNGMKPHNDISEIFSILNRCPYDHITINWKSLGYYTAKACHASFLQYIRRENPPWDLHICDEKVYLDRIKEEAK